MRLSKPLNDILGNRTRVEILRTFFKYPGEFTGRHVARLSNLPQAAVQEQLQALADNNVLNVKHFGRSKVFSLNDSNILYKTLKALFEAEEKVLSNIENVLKRKIEEDKELRNYIAHASIYGSIVEGMETPHSDIDLFILFKEPCDEKRINEKFDSLRNWLTTTSGKNLHIYQWNLDKLNRLNRNLLRDIEASSRPIYGSEIKELKKWSDRRKQEARV